MSTYSLCTLVLSIRRVASGCWARPLPRELVLIARRREHRPSSSTSLLLLLLLLLLLVVVVVVLVVVVWAVTATGMRGGW